MLVVASSSRAATYNWNQSVAATYNITTDWTPNGLPGSADTAAVGNSTTASGSVLYDSAAYAYALNVLQLGQVAGGTDAFTMSAGAFRSRTMAAPAWESATRTAARDFLHSMAAHSPS